MEEEKDPITQNVNIFRGRRLPEPGQPAGYASIIEEHNLAVSLPRRLTAIANRHHPESTEDWHFLPQGYSAASTLAGKLEFALKWEGVRLDVLSSLFQSLPGKEILKIVSEKPAGAYTRRIWFFYEWLTGKVLDLPDAKKIRAVPAIDPDQQFAIQSGELSRRHRVINNLPGSPSFCPLVWRTPFIEERIAERLDENARTLIGQTHPDVLSRAAAFLLLDDSKASFRIEGVQPPHQRALRWGKVIGEAGSHQLTIEELVRLQSIVIGDTRFVRLGLRVEGGFVGQHDRHTGDPIPEHISARSEDLTPLLEGLTDYAERCRAGSIDPVVNAGATSFGFVFIHPFEDGNGRIHRWLIHHVLAKAGFSPVGIVFPVSAAILRNIVQYKQILESYSLSILPLIDWRPTNSGNVEVLNNTVDFYRFFDATLQTEFLYKCVQETVKYDLPREVKYLEAYDEFNEQVQQIVDMPDRTVDLLHGFLKQGDGQLSNRAKTREFNSLSKSEISRIEELFSELFLREESM